MKNQQKTAKVSTMNNECGNKRFEGTRTYTCNKTNGHFGEHGVLDTWNAVTKSWERAPFPPKDCRSVYYEAKGGESGTYRCQLRDGHPGSHLKTFLTRDTITWADKKEVPWDQSAVDWFLKSGRGYGKVSSSSNSSYHYIVDELGIKPEPASYADDEPEETSVLLTLEDLKVLAYYLSSDDNDDDAPTRAKIDEALKGML